MKKKLRVNQNSRQGQSKQRLQSTRKLGIQLLEARKMMAADVGLTDGFISIYGSDGPDSVSITTDQDQIVVSVLGDSCTVQETRFSADEVQGIMFDGQAGNDVFLNETAVPSIVFGGDGDDVILGGQGNDVISGGAGDDVLIASMVHDVIFAGGGQNAILAESGPQSEQPLDETPAAEDTVEDVVDDSVEDVVDDTAEDVVDDTVEDVVDDTADNAVDSTVDETVEDSGVADASGDVVDGVIDTVDDGLDGVDDAGSSGDCHLPPAEDPAVQPQDETPPAVEDGTDQAIVDVAAADGTEDPVDNAGGPDEAGDDTVIDEGQPIDELPNPDVQPGDTGDGTVTIQDCDEAPSGSESTGDALPETPIDEAVVDADNQGDVEAIDPSPETDVPPQDPDCVTDNAGDQGTSDSSQADEAVNTAGDDNSVEVVVDVDTGSGDNAGDPQDQIPNDDMPDVNNDAGDQDLNDLPQEDPAAQDGDNQDAANDSSQDNEGDLGNALPGDNAGNDPLSPEDGSADTTTDTSEDTESASDSGSPAGDSGGSLVPGNDILIGGSGNDILVGGAGDDWLLGDELDQLLTTDLLTDLLNSYRS